MALVTLMQLGAGERDCGVSETVMPPARLLGSSAAIGFLIRQDAGIERPKRGA